MMGTTVEVISPEKRAAGIVFNEIDRLERLLSKYIPESEVSRLNSQGSLAVSRDTLLVLKEAKRFWLASNGAFDITVGPLLDLWGFREKKFRVPAQEEINRALELVGMEKIILSETDNMVKFSVPGVRIDLGAIAAGFAVDSAVRKLQEQGVSSCLVNAGGDIYCLGDKSGRPWRVAVQDPRKKDAYLEPLALKDKAVATSGDYEQFFIVEGKRYCHIFDPKTGSPADSGVASVTVIAKECLSADALSTSIFVLGKKRGEELAGKFLGSEVSIIEEKDL